MKRFKAGDVVVITKPPIEDWPFTSRYRPKLLKNLVGEICVVEDKFINIIDRSFCANNSPRGDMVYSFITNKYIKKIGVL